MIDYYNITKRYYSNWLGITEKDFNEAEVLFVYSNTRNEVQKGFSNPFDLYIWVQDNKIIVSYGDKAKERITRLESINMNMNVDEISMHIKDIWGIVSKKMVIYSFDKLEHLDNKSYKLGKEDYKLYEDFFIASNPDCEDISWLKDYFISIVDKGYSFAEIVDGRIVCMNDLPDVPYMENEIMEIGIVTLKEHRKEGLAKKVCKSSASEMIANNICPHWMADIENIGSQKLATSIGFKEIAKVIMVTL